MVTIFKTKLYGWENGQELGQVYTKDGSLYNASMDPENQDSIPINLAPILAADKVRLKYNDTEYPSADIQCIVADGDNEKIITSIRLTVDQLGALYKDLHKFKNNLSNHVAMLKDKFDLTKK